MATFVANVAVDMTDLSELALLGDWDDLKVPNTIVGASKFDVTEKGGPAGMHLTGNGLTITGGIPLLGTVKTITVENKNTEDTLYKVSGISVFMGTIQDYFSGKFAPSLFKNNDDITGSSDADVLKGYDGKDDMSGKGDADNMLGGDGNDDISGNGGNDTLKGQNNNDDLDGGAGNDTLYGGNGNNSFIFDSTLDGVNNVDTIADFTVGSDDIQLSKSVFVGIGPNGTLSPDKFVVGTDAGDGDDLIIYDDTTGNLYYDADGSDPGAKVLFATVTGAPTLTNEDFIVIA